FPLDLFVHLGLRPELAPDDRSLDTDFFDVVSRQFVAETTVADLRRLGALLRKIDVERVKQERKQHDDQQRFPEGLEHWVVPREKTITKYKLTYLHHERQLTTDKLDEHGCDLSEWPSP